MVEMINTWAGQIVIAVIVVTILEMILPDGNNKKYIKTIIGIYILFIIIYPAINYFSSGKLNFDTIMSSYNIEEEDNNKLSIETNAQVEKVYKEKLEEKIRKSIEEKNYSISSLKLQINLEEQKYGEITYLEIILFKKEQEQAKETNVINKIETVKIELSKKEEQKEIIPEGEINNLKKFLEEEYGISKDKIIIKEEFYDKE